MLMLITKHTVRVTCILLKSIVFIIMIVIGYDHFLMSVCHEFERFTVFSRVE